MKCIKNVFECNQGQTVLLSPFFLYSLEARNISQGGITKLGTNVLYNCAGETLNL